MTSLAGARLYRLLVRLGVPLRWWCRLQVEGREVVPPTGAGVLIVANHDSWIEPLALGDTLMRAGRPLRFLAKDSLWKLRPVAAVLDGIRQIPLRRGAGDVAAIQAAVDALTEGEAVCIFPEGGMSRGRVLRARRGVSRLAEAAPEAEIVLAAVAGGADLLRFPRRPHVRVTLFRPARPLPDPSDHAAYATALLDEIRERVPPAALRP